MTTTNTQPFDSAAFRRVLGTFATGVTIVTTVDNTGTPLGLTANSFTSVSLDPPLVLVCLDHRLKSLLAMKRSQVFAVNILSESQRDLSSRFASKLADKFSDIEWLTAQTGAPVFPSSIGWLDCRVHQIVSAGDHDVVIGRVVELAERSFRPLGYFRGSYYCVSLEQEAGDRRGLAVYGAIVEHQGRVLLHRGDAGAPWSFPETPALNRDLPLGGLCEMLAEAGAPTELNFLYSVAEIPDLGCTTILYRGELVSTPHLTDSARWTFLGADEVPWDGLYSYETEMTLRRYFRERDEDRFGLFADTGGSGRLAAIDHDLESYSRADAERKLR